MTMLLSNLNHSSLTADSWIQLIIYGRKIIRVFEYVQTLNIWTLLIRHHKSWWFSIHQTSQKRINHDDSLSFLYPKPVLQNFHPGIFQVARLVLHSPNRLHGMISWFKNFNTEMFLPELRNQNYQRRRGFDPFPFLQRWEISFRLVINFLHKYHDQNWASRKWTFKNKH